MKSEELARFSPCPPRNEVYIKSKKFACNGKSMYLELLTAFGLIMMDTSIGEIAYCLGGRVEYCSVMADFET